MSDSSDSPAPAVPPKRLPGSRLHHVYYWLAGLDVITVVLSLGVIIFLAGRYVASVRTNDAWAERLEACWLLSEVASEVTAPANNVFDRELSKDQEEWSKFRSATRRLDSELERMRQEVLGPEGWATREPDEDLVADLPALFDRMTIAQGDMVTKATAIFDIVFGRPDGATGDPGPLMAGMDRDYYAFLGELRGLAGHVRRIQANHLEQQRKSVAWIPAAEIALAGVILLMVGYTTTYGRKLARRIRLWADELSGYRDRLEALVAERTRELATSHQQLRSADRLASIGTLAAGLGHDMNNVLFPIRCRLDAMASNDGMGRDDRVGVEDVRQRIEYLQQLSDGLRLLSLDPDDAEATGDTTDLGLWWDEVRPLFLAALPSKATLEGDIPEGLPPLLIAPHRLTQAVFNLVVNAGEASPEDGTVRVWATLMRGGRLSLGVTDAGTGMTEEVQRNALDPFFTTKKRGLSTGLGLAVVHGIATAAGGSVEIESAPGRGTTMILTVRVADSADPVERHAERSLRATVSASDRRMATFVAALLQSSGFEVLYKPEPAPEDVGVWVVDAAEATPDRLLRYLGGSERSRVVVLGEAGDEISSMEDVVSTGTGGLEEIKGAIRSVLAAHRMPGGVSA